MNETAELIVRAQEGNKAAKDKLVSDNLGLVWSIVRRFENRGHEREELFQVGCIGLIKAIDHFDVEFEVKFSTYAVPVISGEIRRFLRDDGMVKVSRTMKENAWKVAKASDMLSHALGRDASLAEISAATGLSVEEIVMATEANTKVSSIYEKIYQSDGEELYLVDRVTAGRPGVGSIQGETGSADGENKEIFNRILVEQLMEELGEEERRLIQYRYFEEKTQTEVAELLGVNQVKISRLEKKILLKLRETLEG